MNPEKHARKERERIAKESTERQQRIARETAERQSRIARETAERQQRIARETAERQQRIARETAERRRRLDPSAPEQVGILSRLGRLVTGKAVEQDPVVARIQRDLDERLERVQREADERLAKVRQDNEERRARIRQASEERAQRLGQRFSDAQRPHDQAYFEDVLAGIGYDFESLEDLYSSLFMGERRPAQPVEELSPSELTRRRLMATLPQDTVTTLGNCEESNVRTFIATVYSAREADPERTDWDIYLAYRRAVEVEEPDPAMVEKTQIAGLLLEGNRSEASFPF